MSGNVCKMRNLKWIGLILVIIATATTAHEKGFFEYLEYVSPVKTWIAIGGILFIFVGLHFSSRKERIWDRISNNI